MPSLKIANVMLGRGKNGIKQAFLDYNEALGLAGFEAVAIVSRAATVEADLRRAGRNFHAIRQWGAWDVLAGRTLTKICRTEKVAALIAHGNRALSLGRQAQAAGLPLIAVAHNYRNKRCNAADAVIAVAPDLHEHLITRFHNPQRVFLVPNTIRVSGEPPGQPAYRNPPVIGAMGRMVGNKGFDVLCAALAALKASAVPFRAVIAGDGEDRSSLTRAIQTLGLEEDVSLPGWVHDKATFWPNIDIFCIPSRHEPFGIVLLEAWAAGKPVITTDAEGPRAIAAHGQDALLVPRHDPSALAQSIRSLLLDPEKAHRLALAGYEKARTRYARETAAAALARVMANMVAR